MEYVEKLYKLKGSALQELARSLYERDVAAFEEVIVSLAKLGNMRDYETMADMLATVPMRAKTGAENYTDAAFGALLYEQYFNMFLQACRDNAYPESEYIKVLLSAQYAKKDGAFYAWDKSVDRYMTALAKKDFFLAAQYVEMHDKKLLKYPLLISVDRENALNRLLAMALYVKNIDKAAVRDVLMDYEEVADTLVDMYDKVNAKERVAVVRLLLPFKNDGRVRRFLDEVVARDKSKSVREAAFSDGRGKAKSAARFLESMMADGEGLTENEWRELLSDYAFAAVADKIFFYTPKDDGRISVLVYNNGAFLDVNDAPAQFYAEQKIYVLHPTDAADENMSVLEFDIDQPFLQIHRPVFGRMSDEGYFSMRLAGMMIAKDKFDKNVKEHGFFVCDKRVDGELTTAVFVRGAYAVGVVCDIPATGKTVTAGRILFFNSRDIVKIKRKRYISTANPLDMASVPPRAYSELMYSAYKLFQNV